MSRVGEIKTASSLRRFKTYPAYKDSDVEWIGDIPSTWSTIRIKYNTYAKGRIGWQNLRSDEFIDEGPYLVTGMHFKDGGVDWDSCYHIAEERYDMAPEIQLMKDDVLITKDGTIGKVAHIGHLPGPASLNSHLLVLRPLKNEYIPRFMFYLLGSEVFQHYVQRSQSGTTFFGITQEAVVNYPTILPPTEEQKLIVDFLDRQTARIDQLIAKKERQIELLQEKRSALISHAVTKGLNTKVKMKDSGIEWLGEIPEHWEVIPLRWYFKIGSGEFLSNEAIESESDEQNSKPVIGGNGVLGFSSNTNIISDTIVIGRVGALCGNVHLVKAPAWITDNALMLMDIRDFDHEYLSLLLGMMNLNRLANQNAQPLVTGGMIKAQKAILPPSKEQDQIVKHCLCETEKIDSLSTRITESIEKLREYRIAIISAAVTGKIDVREEVA